MAAQERKRRRFDWFVIGGDDLYVVAPNMRAYAAALPNGTHKPYFLGRRFRASGGTTIFNSGGAGYALNAPAVEILASRLDRDECDPMYRHFSEDHSLATCLRGAGVYPHNTQDDKEEERFMPFSPQLHYHYKKENHPSDWYWQYTINMKSGFEAMSREVITWHYLKPKALRRMHALLHFCPLPQEGKGPWRHCADEHLPCRCPGRVRYGAAECPGGGDEGEPCQTFVTKKGPFDGVCESVAFGGDPTPGYVKTCQCYIPATTSKSVV